MKNVKLVVWQKQSELSLQNKLKTNDKASKAGEKGFYWCCWSNNAINCWCFSLFRHFHWRLQLTCMCKVHATQRSSAAKIQIVPCWNWKSSQTMVWQWHRVYERKFQSLLYQQQNQARMHCSRDSGTEWCRRAIQPSICWNCTKSCNVESKLPEYYWLRLVDRGDAYVGNLVKKDKIDESPHENFWCRKPKTGHLKVFGWVIYVKKRKREKTKFDPKSRKHVWLGYYSNSTAYLLQDIGVRKVTLARNVVFDEREVVDFTNELRETENDLFLHVTFEDQN